jgi:hypothetical protein
MVVRRYYMDDRHSPDLETHFQSSRGTLERYIRFGLPQLKVLLLLNAAPAP